MAFYRTLGPITFTNGNTVVAYKEPGLVVWLTEEQAESLAGLIEEVDAHHAPPNSPPLGTPSAGNLGNCVGYPSSQLVGLIDNAQLAHKSITIGGVSTDLGGAVTRDQITGVASNGLVKRSAANTYEAAVAGTDFQGPLQSPVLNTQTVKTAHYTAAVSELIPVSAAGGAINVTLPAVPADKSRVAVKKVDSSVNAVNILTGGSDVIDTAGKTSIPLALQYQSAVLQYFADSATWYAISADAQVAQLDARYAPKSLWTYTYTPLGTSADFANIQAVIDAWAATNLPGVIRIAAGTATLAATGTNLPGALRIPANKPSLIIEGSGQDATKFQLSRSVPRLFDLYGTGSGNAFNNITLRNFSLDGNNVSYASIATGVTVTADTTLVAGQFTAVPVNSNTPFVNAGTNWCSAPTSNTGTSAGSFMLYSLTGGTTVNLYNATGSNKTIKSGDSLTGYLYDHVLFGNMHVGSTSGTGQSVSGIRLENITVTNVPTLGTAGLTAYTPSIRFGIYIQPGAGGSVTDVVCRNVRIYGGECGFYVVGNFGTFMDNIVLDSCLHDTGITPTYAYASANYVIGFNSWVNRVDVRNCRGYGSGDVGLEIDQPISASATGCRMFNAYDANFYVTNFAPPADSISGPPTATLSGSINSSVTSATINAFPTTLAHEGYAVIDSEIVAYSRASSTSLTLIRGLDSSTAASHSSGATVTFIQARRQSMKFIDCQAINTGPAGIGWWYNTNSFLPIPAIDMNNCTVTNTVTDLTKSAGVMATGNVVGCSMVDCNIIANLNNTTSQAVAYSPIFLRRPGLSGATTAQNNAADVLFRNTKVTMSGSVASSSANLYGAWLADGWWNVAGDLTVRNNAIGPAAGGTGGMFISGTSQLAYIQQAKPLIIFESTSSSDALSQVFCMSAASIMDRVDLSLDLSQAYMSTNQLPWNIPSGLRDQFFVKDVVPPRLATGANASNPFKVKDVTVTPYAARLVDRIIRVNYAGAAVVNLPATNSGNALAIPRPGAGASVTVKDISGAAATNNITINAAAGETIDGSASVVINKNYGHLELVSNGTGWNIVGSGPNAPAVFEATDQGYISWAFDPGMSYNGNAPSAGVVYVTAVPIRRSCTITNVINCVGVAGSGLTSGQNFAALYNSAGTLLSQTADQTTAWASTGIKTMALGAAQAVTPGIYYVAVWSNGTTPPKFLETITTVYGGALINGTPVRFGTGQGSVTTTAPSTLSGPTAGAIGFWAAVS